VRHSSLALWALLAAGALAVSGCYCNIDGSRVEAQVSRYKALPSAGFEEVRIVSRDTSIVVEAGDQPEIDVTFEVTGRSDSRAKAERLARETRSFAKADGKLLVIETRFPEAESRRDGVSCDYHITMPASLALTVKTTNGRVEVTTRTAPCSLSSSNGSVECSGVSADIAISTSNGRISLSDSAGKVDASTSNGSISGADLDLQNAQGYFRTSNASIRLTGIRGSLLARTSNGKLDVEFSALGGEDTLLETSNGSVELGLPASANVSVTASTSNGNITSSYPFATSSVTGAGSSSTGRFSAAAPKTLISVNTSNASIHIGRGQ
jgi:hypothetical protein